MTAPCEWCAKHRKSLRQMEDDIIAIERGGAALEMLVGTDEYDPTDGVKFIASQLHVIGCRMAETFSVWGFLDRTDGEGQPMTAIGHAAEETKADEYPPLEQAARERLYTLLSEAADMGIALNRLLEMKHPQDCSAAWPELHRALDSRLARAMNIVAVGNEEGGA